MTPEQERLPLPGDVREGCLEEVTSQWGFSGGPDQVGGEQQHVGLLRVSRLSCLGCPWGVHSRLPLCVPGECQGSHPEVTGREKDGIHRRRVVVLPWSWETLRGAGLPQPQPGCSLLTGSKLVSRLPQASRGGAEGVWAQESLLGLALSCAPILGAMSSSSVASPVFTELFFWAGSCCLVTGTPLVVTTVRVTQADGGRAGPGTHKTRFPAPRGLSGGDEDPEAQSGSTAQKWWSWDVTPGSRTAEPVFLTLAWGPGALGSSPGSAILEGVALSESITNRVPGFLLLKWGGAWPQGSSSAVLLGSGPGLPMPSDLCAGGLWA